MIVVFLKRKWQKCFCRWRVPQANKHILFVTLTFKIQRVRKPVGESNSSQCWLSTVFNARSLSSKWIRIVQGLTDLTVCPERSFVFCEMCSAQPWHAWSASLVTQRDEMKPIWRFWTVLKGRPDSPFLTRASSGAETFRTKTWTWGKCVAAAQKDTFYKLFHKWKIVKIRWFLVLPASGDSCLSRWIWSAESSRCRPSFSTIHSTKFRLDL